jgi:hypothetical protein
MKNRQGEMRRGLSGKIKVLCTIFLFFIFHGSLFTVSRAGLVDRVVAYVDDRAITMSELEETFDRTRKVQPDITRREVLDTMINRMLLLNEAKRLRFEGKSDEDLLNEYMELKVKAFIRFREEDIEDYYRKNIAEFKEAPYESVRERIEHFLTEREINSLLKKQIEELRAKAYIKIMIREPAEGGGSGEIHDDRGFVALGKLRTPETFTPYLLGKF